MDSDVSNDCEQDDNNRDELYPNESNPNESNANDADDTDIDSAEGDDADSSEANGSSNSSESKDQLRDNATNDMGDICDKLSSLCLPDTVARIANQLFSMETGIF